MHDILTWCIWSAICANGWHREKYIDKHINMVRLKRYGTSMKCLGYHSHINYQIEVQNVGEFGNADFDDMSKGSKPYKCPALPVSEDGKLWNDAIKTFTVWDEHRPRDYDSGGQLRQDGKKTELQNSLTVLLFINMHRIFKILVPFDNP